jgi:hypothetical protein
VNMTDKGNGKVARFQVPTPNVVVEWLTWLTWSTLFLRTRDVQGSNLGPETGYPEFSWFSAVPPSKCRDSSLK